MNKTQAFGTLSSHIVCCFMTACAPSLVLTGTKTEAIHPEKVRLYFTERPTSEYHRVGYLNVRGGYYSQATLFEAHQQRAAMVGAEGVCVQEIRRLDILEFVGSAIATRCNAQGYSNYPSSSSLPSSSSSMGRFSNTSSRSLGVSTTVSSSSINPTSKNFCRKEALRNFYSISRFFIRPRCYHRQA